MSRFRIGMGVVALAAVTACGMASTSAFDASGGSPSNADRTADAGSGAAMAPVTGIPALDNGVILVHAANTSAFRLCFENEPNLLPQPDSQVMPDSNIVAVEIGTAVRIDPLHGPPGKVTLYNELALRGMYGPDKSNPTCAQLKTLGGLLSTNLGSVPDNLAQNVHVLAVTGCVAGTGSTANCGPTYDDATGNLAIFHEELPGYQRTSQAVLPMQVMHLSQALASKNLEIVFHDGDHPGTPDTPIASGLVPFDVPMPGTPAQLPFDGSDAGVFASYAVHVKVAPDAGSDAGGSTLLAQSLADIQGLSSPRDLPTTYYAKASNFVLLLLGDPGAVQVDGGGDPYRVPHLLAIPVIEPKPDAGADGGDAGF